MKRIALLLSYDGTDYHGFANQVNQKTVAGEINSCLSKIFNQEVYVVCAGRTDAGVHAEFQVVHFDVDERLLKKFFDKSRLLKSLNKMLDDSIGVLEATEVSDSFHARFSAKSRTYNYFIIQEEFYHPMILRYAYPVPQKLDLDEMNLACSYLSGESDFSAFCKSSKLQKSNVRRVNFAAMKKSSLSYDVFEINANAFCHQMVRSIVGLLLEIGTGKRPASELDRILKGKSRTDLTFIAPPHGLHLVHVEYQEELFKTDHKVELF